MSNGLLFSIYPKNKQWNAAKSPVGPVIKTCRTVLKSGGCLSKKQAEIIQKY